ncbi:MAG: AAA family ATPase [bacterium]|nr:AAA family ATPase [bacterium]
MLCQQVLNGEAKDRLKRFWEFIQKDVATTVRTNEESFAEAVKGFSAVSGYLDRIDQSLMEELDELNKGIGDTIRTNVASCRHRFETIGAALKDDNWNAVTVLSVDASGELNQLETNCTENLKRCEANTNASERERVEKELKDYEFRELAFNNRLTLKGHLRNVQTRARLNSCLKATDTTSITRKGNQLMEDALTGELRKALHTECENLGASGIPLQLKKSGSYGSTLHQVGLKDAQVTPSGVLSEGEQRIVAIASFFAELGTSDHSCGIVFDDPVCSLDHRYRSKVAARMAHEGAKRQVIVFTHDLLFLSRLMEACEHGKVEYLVESVRRVGNRCGVCDESIPWDGMKTSKRIGALKNTHQALKALYDKGDHDEYDRLARNCYDNLRKGWERAVEEVLLGGCIQRFAPEVQTQRLKYITVTSEDCEAVDKGMTKCSAWISGHDHAAADNSPVPEPVELLSDILELEAFVVMIRKRQENKPSAIAQQKPDLTYVTKSSVTKKSVGPN